MFAKCSGGRSAIRSFLCYKLTSILTARNYYMYNRVVKRVHHSVMHNPFRKSNVLHTCIILICQFNFSCLHANICLATPARVCSIRILSVDTTKKHWCSCYNHFGSKFTVAFNKYNDEFWQQALQWRNRSPPRWWFPAVIARGCLFWYIMICIIHLIS